MTSSVLAVLAVLAAAARLRRRRRPAQERDEFQRAGGAERSLTVGQAALRGGGTSAWMRPGGG